MTLAAPILLIFSMAVLSLQAGGQISFEQQIRPLLVQHCSKCHGEKQQKSSLRLDVRQPAFKGGDNGAVIVPGNSHASPLWQRISSTNLDERMPPDGPPLKTSEIELLQRWIDDGANWPETDYDRMAARDSRLEHWAWQPIINQEPPTIHAESSHAAVNEIDLFVQSKLIAQQLSQSPEADRRTLIRRLSFDLHGLPPTIEAVEAFVNDSDPKAVEQLVDRMLASPHYGERWARHWLDIAHYADTHGFERDQRRDNAWHYRDWVIRALNDDMPYNQFLRMQIAGDVLHPDDANAVAATGFLAAGPWDFVGQAETPSPTLKRLARADDLDDMITQVMTATCGVTINCARCHDHKLDPISQREYYALSAVFAGVKRGDRILSKKEQQSLAAKKADFEKQIAKLHEQLMTLGGSGWNLADIVGGGNGTGSGQPGAAIDLLTGMVTDSRRGFLEGAPVNHYVKSPQPFIDGVVIPDGESFSRIQITSSGIEVDNIADTSGKAWDSIRNGPVNSQFSTVLGGVDFAADGHTLLALHANAAITFDMAAMRAAGFAKTSRLFAQVGYFGQTPKAGACFHVFLDGKLITERRGIGRDDGLIDLNVIIPSTAEFLTLMATDNGNGIGHDQICFADAVLLPNLPEQTADDIAQIKVTRNRIEELRRQLAELPAPAMIYGINVETPPAMHIMVRGNPEQTGDEVRPGTISCVPSPATFGESTASDAERRIALADWLVSAQNPLTARVIVNRLWHHHFGVGIVDTPSDFGTGGGLPSHPELLDCLAIQLQENNWSLKSIHRLICLSATYRQASRPTSESVRAWHLRGHDVDAENRLLWRQNPRRIDAESLHDAVLAASGKLNLQMFGPGYRDFEYKEEYAPVYSYITADEPNLWRRSIYRFVVRTSPDPFLTTLDCPNAANLTPTRNITTTALQSLALMNNEFMIKQAQYLAERLASLPDATTSNQVAYAFKLVFGRPPTPEESNAATTVITHDGAVSFCRALLNSNEFVFVD